VVEVVDVESKRKEEARRRGAGDVVLVARVCHLVKWQLCKLPSPAAIPYLATVDSLLNHV
jgi:hypothetical protein